MRKAMSLNFYFSLVFLLVIVNVQAEKVNSLVNPRFEKRYAARRVPKMEFPDKHVRKEHKFLPGFVGEAMLPYAWSVVPRQDGQGRVSWDKKDGRELFRIEANAGEVITLGQKYLEIVPGAEYSLTLKVQGNGKVETRLFTGSPGPRKKMVDFSMSAEPEFKEKAFTFKTEPHGRLAKLVLTFIGPCDICVSEVGLWSESQSEPAKAGAKINGIDNNTLFYEGFEKPLKNASGNPSKVVEGRYGKGLKVSPENGGTAIPLSGFDLPDEGTVEFWFKPDGFPIKQRVSYPLSIGTQSPSLKTSAVQFQFSHWRSLISFHFKKSKFTSDKAYGKDGLGWGWWCPATWHHLAGVWDSQGMRIYVDGVIEGVNYKPNIVLPNGKAIDIRFNGPGIIDDVRISKGNRFTPPLPAGLKLGTWNPKLEKSANSTAAQVAKLTAAEIAETRIALISPVPEIKADYVFSVAKAKPSWDGMSGVKLESDFYGEGHDRMIIKSKTPGASAYWKLEGIEPGEYYVCMQVESQFLSTGIKTEYSPEHLALMTYLNGWPLRFETSSDPVQVKASIWLCELQSKDAVALKNGDEIAFSPAKCWMSRERPVGKLLLYKKEPKRGHGITGQTWGVDHRTLQRLRLILTPSFSGSGKDGDEHELKLTVANPLPCEVEANLQWQMTDYYGAPIWTGNERVKLAPHKTAVFTHKFTAKGEDLAYLFDVKSQAAEGYRHPFQRPEEWLEFNDYTKMRFRPDLDGPLKAWNKSRLKLKTINSGNRKRISLDGKDWEHTWLATRRVPEKVPTDLKFGKAKVPYGRYLNRQFSILPEEKFGTWNRKNFVLPDKMKGQRVLLKLSPQTETEATIFLNGERFEPVIPLRQGSEVDVTSAIRKGENELIICLRDPIALVREDFVDKYSSKNKNLINENQERAAPVVHPGWVACGNISVISEPKVGVRQALVLSDLGKQVLKVMLRVKNSTPEQQEVKISFNVAQNGKKTATEIPNLKLSLKPWEMVETSVKASGKNLIPYKPKNPIFSTLEVKVENLSGQVCDTFKQRFGYRSFWVDGLTMNFNGKPARFFGVSQYPARSFFEKESDVILERIALTEERFDQLDECGRLHYHWEGIPFPKGWKVLNNERFWKDNQARAIESLWKYGSHPCFVGLNISNESYHYATSTVGRDGQKKHAERIYSIAEAVEKAFDWDFWFMADGDADLDGKLDFCSFHYLNQQGSYSYKPGTLGMYSNGVNPYSPDCWYLNGAAQVPKKGTEILPHHFVYGSKAAAATEEYWFMVNGPTQGDKIGDRATVSSAWQFYTLRGRSWCWQSYEGYRDMEMAMISGRNESFFGSFQKFVWFSMPEQQVRYYSGCDFQRRFNLHDDEGEAGEIKFDWSLKDSTGEVLESGNINEKSDAMWLHRGEIAFTLPKVAKRQEFKLNMKIYKDGKCYKDEERIIDVWPKPNFPLIKQNSTEESAQALYDPKGLISPILEKIGWKAKKIAKLDSESLKNVKRLVIGPDYVSKDMVKLRKDLLAFTEIGGRILLFKQNNASILPLDSIIDRRGWVSQAFVRAPEHPVMKGLKDRDFTMWQPKHLLAKGLYRKTSKGSVLCLLDAGFAHSMNWSPLLEIYAGKGSILACQLLLAKTFEIEPMSAEILKRMLSYLEQPVYKRMNSKLLVLNPVSEKLVKCLNEVKTEYEIINKTPAPLDEINDNARSVVLIDFTVKGNYPDALALKQFAESGGTIMIHRATPDNLEFLSELIEDPISMDVQPYHSWADRQMLERRDGLLEGLNNIDLYWRDVVRDCTVIGRNQVSFAPKEEHGQVQYIVKTKGAREYLFPGGFSEITLGKGRVIFDQMEWEREDKKNIYYSCGVLPSKTISGILTNLGVPQIPPEPPISLPNGVKYEPIDISNVANRGLKDEKGGDGIGWKDWGPSADLRSFPKGEIFLNTVPFQVPKGEKSAIVLNAARKRLPALSGYPDRISIPVNKTNVAGLWFLQAGGWTYGETPFAHREVIYTDGSKELIQLNSLNFADWNCGRDKFPDERGTRTMVAWKGSTETWPMIRVYQQLWLNPHPEKEIKEVVLSVEEQPEKNRRFVAHLGLTAAILPETQANRAGSEKAEKERDTGKSQELFQKAQKLQLAGKENEALTLVKEALQSDDRNVGAWGLLAEIKAKTFSVAEFENLCVKWSKAVPSSYQAWNVLGRFHESKKMLPEAIKAYRKSLEIEWNQPSILQKLEKLEK